VFQIRVPRNLMGGHHVFIHDLLPLSPVKIDPECSFRKFITKYQTIRRPNPDLIINLQQCTYLKSCNKNIKNVTRVNGNDILRELNYRRAICFLQAALNIIYFSTNSVYCFFISCHKQTEEMNRYQYKYTF
jgi:hypothetical protein